MTLLPKNENGCPFLILAPMEGVGCLSFRKATASIGGFDEAVRFFIRVPRLGHVKSLGRDYDPFELAPIPLAAQLMGSEPGLMGEVAQEIEKKGANRIDLNCGCPSNTVTGKGAGSSLLKDPNQLHEIAKALVKAVSIPVTLKMRSGYEDISLFRENLHAAQESGVRYITLHPRTKVDGYGPPARWDLIAEAKSVLKIPLVGNGDILTVDDALNMIKQTGCDALMIGRGSIINPFLFQEIKAHYAGTDFIPKWEDMENYLQIFIANLSQDSIAKVKVSRLKQLFSYLFRANQDLLEKRQSILSVQHTDLNAYMDFVLPLYKQSWKCRKKELTGCAGYAGYLG